MGTKTFADLTTFRTGGAIAHYFEISDKDELAEKISFAKSNNLPIFILGGGSDILVSDKDFGGVVIKYTSDKVEFKENGKEVSVTADSGLEWDKFVGLCVERNLQGIECLSAIPGSVGAAPIQNIGAYGQELKDTFVELEAYDIEKEKFTIFSNEDCQFGYRDSIFKRADHWQKFVICSITLKLNKNDIPTVKYESVKRYLGDNTNPTLQKVRAAVTQIRSERLENWREVPNAGSYFKNPIIDEEKKSELESLYPEVRIYPFQDKYKIFAGWLVENAGWKGRGLGPVKVSDKHALIIVNPDGQGKAEDVLNLAEAIKNDVFSKFGIELEPEVQHINF